ncbi:MAG: hypothetical protein Ct9H300mP16_19310 [Pseudomonadota bacterium]|nr:MAG: hypothetical protein Ct9H300mP16_19310 [Pseudomonadota bacterium]
MGTHSLDWLRWMMVPVCGEVVDVNSIVTRNFLGSQHDESAVVSLRFKSGAVAQFVSSALSLRRTGERSVAAKAMLTATRQSAAGVVETSRPTKGDRFCRGQPLSRGRSPISLPRFGRGVILKSPEKRGCATSNCCARSVPRPIDQSGSSGNFNKRCYACSALGGIRR